VGRKTLIILATKLRAVYNMGAVYQLLYIYRFLAFNNEKEKGLL
jgi:hypothetical protein